jgi:hypothetical protein
MTMPPFDRTPVLDYAPYELPPAELAHDPRLRADVEARLRGICGHLTADAFAALVDEICARKRRWARDCP